MEHISEMAENLKELIRKNHIVEYNLLCSACPYEFILRINKDSKFYSVKVLKDLEKLSTNVITALDVVSLQVIDTPAEILFIGVFE